MLITANIFKPGIKLAIKSKTVTTISLTMFRRFIRTLLAVLLAIENEELLNLPVMSFSAFSDTILNMGDISINIMYFMTIHNKMAIEMPMITEKTMDCLAHSQGIIEANHSPPNPENCHTTYINTVKTANAINPVYTKYFKAPDLKSTNDLMKYVKIEVICFIILKRSVINDNTYDYKNK